MLQNLFLCGCGFVALMFDIHMWQTLRKGYTFLPSSNFQWEHCKVNNGKIEHNWHTTLPSLDYPQVQFGSWPLLICSVNKYFSQLLLANFCLSFASSTNSLFLKFFVLKSTPTTLWYGYLYQTRKCCMERLYWSYVVQLYVVIFVQVWLRYRNVLPSCCSLYALFNKAQRSPFYY